MHTKSKSRLSILQFTRLSQKETASELRNVLDTHMNLKLSSNNAYMIKFLERKFLFVLTSKYAKGNLVRNLVSTKLILGFIMTYDVPSRGYVSDKIIVSEPLSQKKMSFKILDLRGRSLYSGTGDLTQSEIHFTIKGEASEGPVRTKISGTIGSSGIRFTDCVMPNKIFKKRQQPVRLDNKNALKKLL